LATLSLAGLSAAHAAHIAVSATIAAVTVTGAQAFDYIEVKPAGRVTGSITNNGALGLPGGSFGIAVDAGGSVGGAILNTGSVAVVHPHAASDVIGIDARGPVAGGIANSGRLFVTASGTNTHVHILGVRESGSPVESLTNAGTLSVTARGAGKFLAVSQQAADAALATAFLANAPGGLIQLRALATGSSARASAAAGVTQRAAALFGAANATLSNSGTLDLEARALSTSGAGNATAVFGLGIKQRATGSNVPVQPGGIDAAANLTNSGVIKIDASGRVKASSAHAMALVGTGIYQLASGTDALGVGNVSAGLTNSGTIEISAKASATAIGGAGHTARAAAEVTHQGVFQFIVFGRSADATVTNSGTLDILAAAHVVAKASASAFASIRATHAIYQFLSATNLAGSVAQASLTNSGTLTIAALAQASGARASAFAILNNLEGAIAQFVGDADTDNAILTNSGTFLITDNAAAKASAGPAVATAFDRDLIRQTAIAANNKVLASAALTNSGTLTIAAIAQVTAAANATAKADDYDRVRQSASGALTNDVSLNNSGVLSLIDQASARAGGRAHAIATSAFSRIQVLQSASGGDAAGSAANAAVSNSGALNIEVIAAAKGTSAAANASIPNFVLEQRADNADAVSVTFANAASLAFVAQATATGTAKLAVASARIGRGVFQSAAADAAGVASASFTNSGTLNLKASAIAHAHATEASAHFGNEAVLFQVARKGRQEAATIINSGTVHFAVLASATGARTEFARIFGAEVIEQAIGASPNASITNTGSFEVTVNALALRGVNMTAEALGVGIVQSASATAAAPANPIASISNSGMLTIAARAEAGPGKTANANVGETGILERLRGGPAKITNSGKLVVSVSATASASAHGTAGARAQGLRIDGTGSSAAVDVTNSGTLAVSAKAKVGGASRGAASGNGVAIGDATNYSGTVENDGTISVSVSGHRAGARAIEISANSFQGAVVNKGMAVVAVSAAVGGGETAVLVTAPKANGGVGAGTVTNDGGTIIGETIAGGIASRANAINISGAGNPVTVNLEGTGRDGHIYGNIIDATGDAVVALNGKTAFDGVINGPATMVGSLGIAAGGTLELVRNIREGSASAYVNSFSQAGTLQIDVDTTAASAGSIHANQAVLGGAITINPAVLPAPGSVTYRVVFSAMPLSGTWAEVGTVGDSAVLQTTAIYLPNEADVTLTRIPFHAVPGLTPNEAAVASALDTAQAASVGGTVGDLVNALVPLPLAPLTNALNALADQEDGELQLSDLDGAQVLVEAINERLSAVSANGRASAFALGAVLPAQLSDLGGHIWGGAFGTWNSADATISGPRFSDNQGGIVAGFDTSVDNSATAGGALAYTHGAVAMNDRVGHGDYRGFELALYGRYDAPDAPWYAMGSATYGSFRNGSARLVAIPNFGAGVTEARFHSNLWALYGEGGYRFATGSIFELDPYLALEILDGESNSYTQTGGPIALAVSGTSAHGSSSFLGFSLSTAEPVAGTPFVPTLRVSWQHEFETNPWTLDAAFAGVPITGFRVSGAALSKDHADIGAGLRTALSADVDAMFSYEGRLGGNRSDGAVIGRALVRF
jgi:uncharacterized protein with beta-barrel porin domain